MAMTGPIPNRSQERRRRNARTVAGESTEAEVVYVDPATPPVEAPPADPSWHDIAKNLYDSVCESAVNHYYEPSDWMVLYTLCESLSRDLQEQVVGTTERGDILYASIPLKPAAITAYLKGFAALMLTEGDRRRLRLEIDRNAAATTRDATVESIVSTRADLALVQGGA